MAFLKSGQQISDAGNSGALVGVTTERSITVATISGSKVLTSAALFLASDVGSAVTGTGIPANAIIVTFTSTSSVTFKAAPQYPSNPDPAATATGAPTATIRVGVVGTWRLTQARGVVRELTIVGSTVLSGLGGTFCFQYSEDGSTATVNEVRAISSFSTIRDFDLENVGLYYRIMIAPSRVLTAGETLFYTTKLLTQYGGDFVRLADQQIERQNAAMGNTFSYLKGWTPAGLSQDFLMNSQGVMINANFLTEVAKGNVPGHALVAQSGVNPDIDTAFETIWGSGGIYTPVAVAAIITFTVNVADIGLGLSATIVGLNSSGAYVTETIALTLIATVTTSTWLAIQSVTLSGTVNPANDIAVLIGATNVGTITAGSNITRIGYFHVPTGKTAYLIDLVVGNSNNTAASNVSRLMVQTTRTGLFREIANFTGHSQSAPLVANISSPYKFLTGEVVRLDMTCGANNNIASCTMGFLVIDN